MRIGVDARSLLSPKHRDNVGTGHFVLQSLKEMVATDAGHHWVLFVDEQMREKDLHFFKGCKAVTVVHFPERPFLRYLPWVYNEFIVARVLKREQLDLFYLPDITIRVPVRYRRPFITMCAHIDIHLYPEHYPSWRVRRQRAIMSLNIRRAQHIVAPAKCVREHIKSLFGRSQEDISVVLGGVDVRFFKKLSGQDQKVARRFGITKKYILFAGTIEPSKNVTRLAQAFALFREKRTIGRHRDTSDYQMLIVGRDGYQAREMKEFIADLDLGSDIRFTSYVTGEEMGSLQRSAAFSVVPTIGEHYGLTALEACASGVPCVVHKGGVAEEIGGSSIHSVDTYDTHTLADAFEIFDDDVHHTETARESRIEHARRYTWSQTAQKIVALCEQYR